MAPSPDQQRRLALFIQSGEQPRGFLPPIPSRAGERPICAEPEVLSKARPHGHISPRAQDPLSAATGRWLPHAIGQSPRDVLTARNPFSVNTSDTREICKPLQARAGARPELTNGEAMGKKRGGGGKVAGVEVTPASGRAAPSLQRKPDRVSRARVEEAYRRAQIPCVQGLYGLSITLRMIWPALGQPRWAPSPITLRSLIRGMTVQTNGPLHQLRFSRPCEFPYCYL